MQITRESGFDWYWHHMWLESELGVIYIYIYKYAIIFLVNLSYLQ